MECTIMAIAINPRTKSAPTVQEILTKHGCIIKTRLGLHETSEATCSQRGLILLQLRPDAENIEKLKADLTNIEGVTVNTMVI
ncbi:hypothetical protein [Oceanirhabdus seepicola]|uniref:Iron-only hydrogenase system regulator n=1 Tax=Oceanirhabdus seepicola TaxID=2828781 RepID=A0A9J6PC17_9CLOT|nr:hypothetical protein [Oceanirhabdus seepicola]MCM1992589.1 hypothetical protein [Oceanirhabdus seepicola]